MKLDKEGKMPCPGETFIAFLELKSDIFAQIVYHRKEVYCSLIIRYYRYYQSLETPPNIFDTRWSFLLKVEKNKNMRDNFLKSYNRRESEN